MIKLTSIDSTITEGEGDPIFLNPNEVAVVEQRYDGQGLFWAGVIMKTGDVHKHSGGILVTETPAEVAALIEAALGKPDTPKEK